MRALRIACLALEGLRRTPLRVTLTTLGVTIATSALVSMVAIAVGVQRQVETPFRALGLLNNVQVKPDEGEDKKDAPPLDDAALASFEQLPGVVAAYPDMRLKGIKIRYGEKEESSIGVAMPREAALFGIEEEILIAGRFFDEGTEPEAILGAQIVRGLGFASPHDVLGKQVALEAAGLAPEKGRSFSFQRRQIAVTVVGVYDAPALLPGFAHRGILLPVEVIKQVPGIYFESAMNRLKAGITGGKPSYPSATVRVEDPSYLSTVEEQVREMGFQAHTVLSRLQGMRMFFIAIKVLLTVVGTIAMLIAALGIANTLLMAVLERYQEIGICKAIGASDGDLLVLFLTEAGAIGFLGGLSGLLLGWLTCLGLQAAATAYAHGQGVTGPLELFAFPWWLAVSAVAFAVVVSILAGTYPALRAARVDPIRALRSH